MRNSVMSPLVGLLKTPTLYTVATGVVLVGFIAWENKNALAGMQAQITEVREQMASIETGHKFMYDYIKTQCNQKIVKAALYQTRSDDVDKCQKLSEQLASR